MPLGSAIRATLDLIKKTYAEWSRDNASRLAAAFSYYAIFSIGPLLLIGIMIVGLIYGQRAAQNQIRPQLSSLLGDNAAGFVQELIRQAGYSPSLSFAGILAIILLIYASTNVFISLQDALNTIFNVQPRAGRGMTGILQDRALSFLMVLIIGVFLLASVVLSTVLVALLKFLPPGNPTMSAWILQGLNFLVSGIIFTGIFALLIKFLPDIRIDWRDTLIGAAFTSVLFTLGRIGLGYYLNRSSTAGPFGAAGSLVIVMLFVYYSAQIFFLGAEFTQVWACRHGQPITPSSNATPRDPLNRDLAKEEDDQKRTGAWREPRTGLSNQPA